MIIDYIFTVPDVYKAGDVLPENCEKEMIDLGAVPDERCEIYSTPYLDEILDSSVDGGNEESHGKLVPIDNNTSNVMFRVKSFNGEIIIFDNPANQRNTLLARTLKSLLDNGVLDNSVTIDYCKSIGMHVETVEDLSKYFCFMNYGIGGYVFYLPDSNLEVNKTYDSEYGLLFNEGSYMLYDKNMSLEILSQAFNTNITNITFTFVGIGYDESAYNEGYEYGLNNDSIHDEDNPYDSETDWYKFISWNDGAICAEGYKQGFESGHTDYSPNGSCNPSEHNPYLPGESIQYYDWENGYHDGWDKAEQEWDEGGEDTPEPED